MDTTPKYIKMCEKAWFDLDEPRYIPTLGHYIKNQIYETDEFGQAWYRSEFEDRVPLYRQDQLQEMLPNEPAWDYRFSKFCNWLDKEPGVTIFNTVNSLEQLWLAFVMQEKYGKVWDDKKEEWNTLDTLA